MNNTTRKNNQTKSIQHQLNLKPYIDSHAYGYMIIMVLLIIMLVFLSLMYGSYHLSFTQVYNALWQPINPVLQGSQDIFISNIKDTKTAQTDIHTMIWQLRLPRSLVALMAGALFALSGAILQNITRNPLADPSLIGVSQGASLAVVISIVLFPSVSQKLLPTLPVILQAIYRPMIALAGALLAATGIYMISLKNGTKKNQVTDANTLRFILTGIGIASFIAAMIAAMLTYGQINQAQAALNWLSGSMYASNWQNVCLLFVALLCCLPYLFLLSRDMSVLRMGHVVATGLGVPTRRSLRLLIMMSVVLAAFGVAVVGPLSFVGLLAPHLTKRLFRTSINHQLWLSALVGAFMVALADLIGRTIVAPFQIPAGLITVIIGVPFFFVLMLKQKVAS